MKVLVSACLLGCNCKYNGGNNRNEAVCAFAEGKEMIAVCPEMLAGLGVPRTPIDIVEGVVKDREGRNVDAPLRLAVAKILKDLEKDEICCAVLKSRSPTCGVKQVYDGTFSGTLVAGAGILAKALIDAGYRVIDCEDLVEECENLEH